MAVQEAEEDEDVAEENAEIENMVGNKKTLIQHRYLLAVAIDPGPKGFK